MKNHTITLDGKTYFTAQVIDAELGKTHDMTAIFMETDPELPPKFIDFYYGDPDLRITADYIARYNARQVHKPVRTVTTLNDLKEYKAWVDHLVDADQPMEAIERLYDTQVKIEVNGKAINIDFDCVIWNAVCKLLDNVIEEF